MTTKEEVLNTLRSKGPLVPNELRKLVGSTDSMIVGAVLSELTSRGMVKISNLKKGGSPFYYLPGQEAQLEKFIEFLNPKDQKTLRLLKEQKVVHDKSQELFVRVSLRQIKDFAIPFELTTKENGPQIFWRYYLVSEQDAVNLVYKPNKVETPPPQEVLVQETPKQEVKEETSAQVSKTAVEEKQETKTKPTVKTSDTEAVQKSIPLTPRLEKTKFYDLVIEYFKKSNITLISEEQVSKDRDYDFVIDVPSGVGNLKMFCKARNKKKLTEGDVAPALLKAKTKELPCLFLTNGQFTKKSLGIINKEYKGLVIKNL